MMRRSTDGAGLSEVVTGEVHVSAADRPASPGSALIVEALNDQHRPEMVSSAVWYVDDVEDHLDYPPCAEP